MKPDKPAKDKCPPIWFALGAFIVTPFTAVGAVITGVLILVSWPIIPFLCYFQRRDEIKREGEEG